MNVDRKRARLGAARLTPATLTRRIGEARKLASRDLARAQAAFVAGVRNRRKQLARDAGRLSTEPLVRQYKRGDEKLKLLVNRKDKCIDTRLDRLSRKLEQAGRLLDTLSYQSVLERGFAVVQDKQGTLVKRVAEVSSGQALTLRFADGTAGAIATGESAARPKSVRSARKPTSGQGSLF